MKNVFVMGANPAWQKTLLFPELKTDAVNRAERMEAYSSGKGVNVCRAARCFGKAKPFLFQFAGGINGKLLCDGLNAEGFAHETVMTNAETRCCITCLDKKNGTMTELIEPSHALTEDETAEFLKSLLEKISEASIFVISGSLPDGSDLSLYEKAARIAVDAGIPVVVDTVKGIAPVLELEGKIILKVNQEEFFKITSCTEINEAHKTALSRWKNVCFAVTNGPDKASLSDSTGIYFYQIPRLEDVKNPLGAGDTATAVMASEIVDGKSYKDAFRTALAAASANCLSEKAGEFLMSDLEKIAENILWS